MVAHTGEQLSSWASYLIRKIAGCACAGNAGNVFPAPRVGDPEIHHGTCVTHVPWCMPVSLTSGFIWSRWRGKHSRHMHNLQLYVSGKRPMLQHAPMETLSILLFLCEGYPQVSSGFPVERTMMRYFVISIILKILSYDVNFIKSNGCGIDHHLRPFSGKPQASGNLL